MTTSQTAATGREAFTAAVAARDVDALVEALAPHPVLRSAATGTPFEGRAVLADLYASLFESFEELRVTDEFQAGDVHAFFWEGRSGGRFVEGADRVRLDRDGRVAEITVVGRPLAGVATFLGGTGHRFARRRRGRLVAAILRVAVVPIAPLLSLLDPVSRWLARDRGAERASAAASPPV
jgi:hypothetical protein